MVRQDRCPGRGEQHKGTLHPPFDTHLAATWEGTAGQGRARGAHVSGCTHTNSTAARDGGLKVRGAVFPAPSFSFRKDSQTVATCHHLLYHGGAGSGRPQEPRTDSGSSGAWSGERYGTSEARLADQRDGPAETERTGKQRRQPARQEQGVSRGLCEQTNPTQAPKYPRLGNHSVPGKQGKRHEHGCLGTTHLKWSCSATLKSKASPRSTKPIPINARRPGGQHRINPTRQRQRKLFLRGGTPETHTHRFHLRCG